MKKELLQKVRDQVCFERGFIDYECFKSDADFTDKEAVESEIIHRYAEAYAAKLEQKQHLVKMNEEREDELHPDSNNLLKHCFEELRLKMIKNQEKYGYGNEWLTEEWEQECRDNMMEHIQKGDPRDVAIYALFMMYRGWSTKSQNQTGEPCFTKEMIEDRFGFPASEKEVEWFNARACQYASDRVKKVFEDYSKEYELTVGGSLLLRIRISEPGIEVVGAIDGYGHSVANEISINEITDPKNLEV